MFEDSRGDIWIGVLDYSAVYRWERASDRLVQCRQSSRIQQLVGAFGEDRAGNIWVGLSGDGVLRYRNGAFERFSERDGVPKGGVLALLTDRQGRLWMASTDGGLGRVDEPAAERPTFQAYTTAQGLSSNSIACLTDDEWGRIYACTNTAVDRLDPATGSVRHYSIALGFPLGTLYAAMRDRSNQLWFASAKGVLSLRPQLDLPANPRTVLFTSLEIAGRPYPLSRLGEDRVSGLELQPGQNHMRIGFVAPGPDDGEPLNYQYSLNGGNWSAPAPDRTVNLVGLKPGGYEFSVRALSPDPGLVARAVFSIVPPVWQRWWFITAAAVSIALMAYALHRLLVAQVLAVESMRTRIATDLHDDIGSSLSQIAIMSELAQRSGNGSAVFEIASLSRDLVDAMSDIVWAINPKHDHLSNLLHRMRRFAEDTLEARGIDVQFHNKGLERDIRAPADVRRQVFLIFKEAVTNAARHSLARNVEVTIELQNDRLRVTLTDDGRGFDPQHAADGNGLANMRERGRKLGGAMELMTEPGRGTTILLTAPLAGRAGAPG